MIKSKYVGIVYEKDTLEVVSVINPDYDQLLNDPAWITSNGEEKYEMVKIKKKGRFGKNMTLANCDEAINLFKQGKF